MTRWVQTKTRKHCEVRSSSNLALIQPLKVNSRYHLARTKMPKKRASEQTHLTSSVLCFLLAPLTKVVRLLLAFLHRSWHAEADHGHLLAAVIFCTRSAVWTRFLTEPVAGLLTLLVVFRQQGWGECSSLDLPHPFGCPCLTGLTMRMSSPTLTPPAWTFAPPWET